MGVKGVCSGCASWVEEGWSYCMHCGAARPIRRSSLFLSTSLYGNSRMNAVALKENRSLRRRRQPSEDVGRQLQQWRRKSKTQEDLLQELERCNTKAQRAVAAETESDLRRVVNDGRALLRTWPSRSAPVSSSILPVTGRGRTHLLRRPSVPVLTKGSCTTVDCSSRKSNGSAGNEVDGCSCSRIVHATVTRKQDELYAHQQSSAQSHVRNIGSQAQADGNFQSDTPPEERALRKRAGKSVHGSNNNDNNSEQMVTSGRQKSSGWFWGAGAGNPSDGGNGDDCDTGIAAPGEGTMAAYWRKPAAAAAAAAGKSPVGGKTGARYAVNSAAESKTPQKLCSSSHQASFGDATENPSCGDEHPLAEETSKTSRRSSHNNSRVFVSIASAKAAVRSASNRAAELSHLLREGNNPPREECLAKAESAIRAAESAISCANERLFQLELMAASESAAQEVDGGMDGAQGTPATEEDEKRPSDQNSRAVSSLSAHIEELTEQLRLAQSLQAVSVTARTRLSRRFALDAAAAIRLQALVRGSVTRWRERRNEATLPGKHATTTAHAAPAFASLDSSSSRGIEVEQKQLGKMALEQEDTHEGVLPRTEGLWWTPAETESADAVGESESALLRAVVKLQAIVRSRLERSQTIAAVNAQFAEHFDEEYQHPFYVCCETNSSQWNAPFGFVSGRETRGSSSRLVRGVGTTERLESPEEIEEITPLLLRSLIKLQAIVRSRLARSQTIAAVNARFVEHFDEEYQHPFYVCTETNSSQWNQPFGFGWGRGEATQGAHDGTSDTLEGVKADTSVTTRGKVLENSDEDEGVAKTDRGGTTSEGAGEQMLCGTLGEQESAVTVIQCGFRAARARAQLTEKIVLASL